MLNKDENTKVLFVIGMEHKLENIIKQKMSINPESILFIHGYRHDAIEPFGNLMREIILAVYMENVEEIYLVSMHDVKKNDRSILNKICERIGSQEEIETVDYLFKNCRPEFPNSNVKEWLEGSKPLTTAERTDVIRNHPLMPTNVKVTELFIDMVGEKIYNEPVDKTAGNF
ncbi:carbonic anhydrase [Bacillus marasmi]|uniref:carbonic anhydrase n=1 Tax=Bacillus marasmi TaxID=1926279 RepID=UPI0011C6FA81|nr:carbonic anhydrase [Bacillus marasmi]